MKIFLYKFVIILIGLFLIFELTLGSLIKDFKREYVNLLSKEKIDKAFKLSLKYRQRLGAISRKHVIKNFSKEKMLKGYLNLYIKNLL